MKSIEMKQKLYTKLEQTGHDDELMRYLYLNSSQIKDGKYKGYTMERILLYNDNILVHLLDKNDETVFVYFDDIPFKAQLVIYGEVMDFDFCYIGEFFEQIQGWLSHGDSMFVRREDEDDDDSLVYIGLNAAKEVIFIYYYSVGVVIRY